MRTGTRMFLLVIFLVGIVVRCVGLGNNPVGIVDDEADIAYDAYSLVQTGKDQWGIAFPITSFRGFGDYRLPLYTYLSVPSVAAFGLTPFAVRLPAAIFGSLTVLLVYFLTKQLFGPSQDILALLAAFFLAISPWHVGMSRIGLEETASVFLVSAGLLFLLKGRQRATWFILGSVLFAVSLYTYTANILLVPFLIAITMFLFRIEFKKYRTILLFALSIFVFLSLPIIFARNASTAATRTRQVNFTNDSGVIDVVNEKQGACASIFPQPACRVLINKYSAFGAKYISNYLNHFSPNFLSIYGTNTQFSILPGRGLLYMLDYFLLIVGLLAVYINQTPSAVLMVLFLFFSAVPDSLTSDGQFARFFVSYPIWPILCALGVVFLVQKFKNSRVPITALVVLYCFFFVSFYVEYWTFFPYRYSHYSHFGYEELIDRIEANISSYERIVVSSRVNDAKQYIYYLFYTRYSPALFQSGKGIDKAIEPQGWVRVARIHSIEFLPTLPGRDEVAGAHTLLIGAPSEFPKTMLNDTPGLSIPIEFTVKDKAGNVLFEGVDSSKLYL